jgi:Xaa-Pro aminopeptidase
MNPQNYVEDKSIQSRRAEIDIKTERITALLEREKLNALYMTRQPNFFWITAGANAVVTICVEEAVGGVLVTKDGKRYVITNVIEANRIKDEEMLEEFGFEILSQDWYENKNAEYIQKIAGDLSNVGSDYYFENCRMISPKISELRYSLTHNEICRYQTLGNEMSKALEEYLATVRPGMTEYEVTGGIANALWPHEIGQVLFLISSDDRAYKYRHGVPIDKKIEKLLLVSCNGRYKGLITTTTRMVHFGKPSEQYLEQFDRNVEIECRMIAATRPGVDEIIPHRIGREALEAIGQGSMYHRHAQGGPQGYYNREYSISESLHKVTVENECYCYQPSIDGTKTEDAFIATTEGPLMITKPISFPKITKVIDGIIIEKPGVLVIE